MFIIKLLAFVLSLTAISSVYAANMWDSGELTYPSGETEISAFVNSDGNTQLQAVLCSKGGQGITVSLFYYLKNLIMTR